MRLLLIDTCGMEGNIALADTEQTPCVVRTESLPGRSSSERLVPSIRMAMEAQAWVLRDLSEIVVVHGPGSFTGMRVGLSAAKGLSEASGVPLIAVSRLAVLAAGAGRVCAVLDAGRGEFYFGEYLDGQNILEALLTRDELVARGVGVVVVCESKVAEAVKGLLEVRLVAEPVAADAIPMALRRLAAGELNDAATIDANYLRRTDEQLFARPKVATVAG